MCQKISQVVWEFFLACLIWLHLFASKRTKIFHVIISILYNVLVLCIDVLLSFSDSYNKFQILSFSFLCFAYLNRFFTSIWLNFSLMIHSHVLSHKQLFSYDFNQFFHYKFVCKHVWFDILFNENLFYDFNYFEICQF